MVQDMKKFASVTVTKKNFPKMDKRTIIRKNRHKKHAAKHSIFNKVVSYLISDSYMYNPLVSPQPSFDLPPPKQILTLHGIKDDVALPVKGRNKKLIEKVVEFLEADCYMYTPLINNNNQQVCSTSYVANKDSGGKMQKGRVRGQVRARGEVKKSVAYRESVNHMVH